MTVAPGPAVPEPAVPEPARVVAFEGMQTTYKTAARPDRQSRRMNTSPRFDTKIAVLLREDLEPWQRLNVTAFLVSGLGTQAPEVVGEPYEDADGVPYLPMFRQPVLVFQGTKEILKAAHARALTRALPRAVFTSDLFSTGHDEANRAAVRTVGTTDLDLVGLAVHGPRNAVDKVLKGASMHP
ncbi:hypothetical protein GCM10010261_55290 [Streptomyces pilosus]|nr:hypothetical protein GCM10010261_55290 [Streptomyces pilosus]